MKAVRCFLVNVAGAVCFSSCTTTLYRSNAVNAPLLREKGEVKINATSNDLQLAAGLSNNLGIMANGYYQKYTSSNSYEHRGGMGELGLGFFTNNEDDNNFYFEAFAGPGFGSVYRQKTFTRPNESPYLGSFQAQAAKLFLQSDFGYSNEFLDVILTPRFSAVKYLSFDHSNYPQEELHDDYLDNNRLTDPVFVFAEPAITVRGGFKYIKLQAQYGLTLNLTGHHIRHPANFSSLGIVIDIGRWYKD